MEWSKESTNRLIEQYREKAVLWDPNDKHYKERNKKQDAWADLAADFEGDVEEVEKKVRMLIGQFQRELKKGKYGDGADAPYKTKWVYFHSLLFLKDKNLPRHQQEVGQPEQPGTSLQWSFKEEPVQIETEQLQSTFLPPPQMKNPSRKRPPDDSKSSDVMNKLSARTRDEFDVFGELVALTLRNLKDKMLVVDAKQHISNILYQAEKQDLHDGSPHVYSGVSPHTSIYSGDSPSVEASPVYQGWQKCD